MHQKRKFGGWTDEGKQRFNELCKKIKIARAMDLVRETLESKVYDMIRDELNTSFEGVKDASSKRKSVNVVKQDDDDDHDYNKKEIEMYRDDF